MQRLFLSPQSSPDSVAIQAAAERAGWAVERLRSHAVPEPLRGVGGAYYGEPAFGGAVAPALGITLQDVPASWLPELPEEYRLREVGLVAEPMSFVVEFRCFVCRRQAVSVAPYARGGQPEKQASASEGMGAAELLLKLLRDRNVGLAPGAVLDVGLIAQRGWALVKAHPAWSAALHGCNADRALAAVAAACGS
jgi:hypothetical protein